MLVRLDLDPKVVSRLEDRAEEAQMSTSQYVSTLLELSQSARPRKWTTTMAQGEATRREVARLHAEGLTDREIAAQVDRVHEYVADVRRKLGLKPNRAARAAEGSGP